MPALRASSALDRTRSTCLQLAEAAFIDEPMRARTAHRAGPNEDVCLGLDD